MAFFYAALCIFATGFLLADDAQASPRKSCVNYTKHAAHSCMTAKHARLRNRHAVYTRPTPASFLMDADSGKILEMENADAPRYPASLTKMMTLYLTFESLKKGRMSLDQTLPVSAHASAQPQTNIALQPGDSLAVKNAILAIVVRSANDAAVTLGEAMGGSEEGFAVKMTAKARQLGMKNTVFYNASGLPEPRQHTTARDMAILGLALRKDFPQYYPFFKTESFSYHGVTYPTHNHVMMRYDGVDGIKTGYIRASGFNLVTAAKKDNHTLIGVVLGGATWKSRDDKMIAMLDRNFDRLMAKRDNPSPAQIAFKSALPAPDPMTTAFDSEEASEGQGDLNLEEPATASQASKAAVPVAETKAAAHAAGNWGIQVGAYARKSDAVKAASTAIRQASQTLGASKVSIGGPTKESSYYRARLVNLTQSDADGSCKLLLAKNITCFSYRN